MGRNEEKKGSPKEKSRGEEKGTEEGRMDSVYLSLFTIFTTKCQNVCSCLYTLKFYSVFILNTF